MVNKEIQNQFKYLLMSVYKKGNEAPRISTEEMMKEISDKLKVMVQEHQNG